MTERKQGKVRGFLTCNAEYLTLIEQDLGLKLKPALMRHLQSVYLKENREPCVAELYFDAALMRSGYSGRDTVLHTGLSADSPEIRELFSRLVSETAASSEIRDSGVSLPAAAEAAVRNPLGSVGKQFHITPADNPEFPAFGAEKCFVSGGFCVCYGKESARLPLPGCPSGVLVTPADGETPLNFLFRAGDFVREAEESIREAAVVPCSHNGLIADVEKSVGTAAVYADLLPGSDGTADTAARSFAPGFILWVPERDAEQVVAAAKAAGMNASVPLYRAPEEKGIRVYSAGEPVLVPAEHAQLVLLYRRIQAKAAPKELDGAGKLAVLASADEDLEAFGLCGNVYGAMQMVCSVPVVYCVGGILNPDDPGTVPAVLALRSFVQNSRPNIAAACFRNGSKTAVTVFRFGATGRILPLRRWTPETIAPAASGVASPLFRAEEEPPKDREIRAFASLEELCGNTPLLRLFPDAPARVYAKLEMCNPAGSAKDRVALQILRDAEASGALREGGTVIEATSGNTGIGLAAYGRVRGYRVIIVMPDTMSRERIDLIRAYGAEVVLTNGLLGMSGSKAEAERLLSQIPGAFLASQFSNPSNPRAHELTTGPEIWNDTRGKIDIFVAGIGTGGTLCGTAAYLKSKNPAVRIVGCEPAASPLLTRGYSGRHAIQGIGADFIPENFREELVDRVIAVSDEDAIAETAAIAKNTGLLAGISSGCAAYAAKLLAEEPENAGKVIVTLFPDTGEHYLSTGIFSK